jgi:N-acetylneuraminic acid mutarotase
MHPAVRVRRVALRALPAGLVALGLVLEGCGERQETPLGPAAATESTGATGAAVQTDKERNAVDLGPASSARSMAMGTLSVSVAGATAGSIPFAPEPGPFANTVPPCDDCVYQGLPIGFSFTFFGNPYTTFNISSNGFIGFSPGMSSGCCSGRTIPFADGFDNIIAAAWTDLYPLGGGEVSYETRGRSPNRYLVVAYQNLPWFPESGINRVTTQIILYEGTNAIEVHTANQSAGHTYTQGIEDGSGTQAAFLTGRVAANYGLTNDGVRFTMPFWTARAALPSARRRSAVAAANGLLYAIGGFNSAGTAVKSVVAFNPSTNTWSTKAPLPAARQGFTAAAAIGGTIYLAGGKDAAGALTRTLYAYNSSSNTWSTRANMPVASACGGSAVISGKLYVFSGCTRSSTNLWTALHSAPAVHIDPAIGVISGRLYVVAGNDGVAGVATRRLDVYDPATNTWSTKAAIPTARTAPAGAAIGGKLHVIGGRNGGTYLNTVEAYDPVTDSWAARPAMPTPRSGLGVGVISSLLYAVGGGNGTSVLARNERYTP